MECCVIASEGGTGSFLGKVNVFKMEKEDLQKPLLEKDVAMKAMTWSVVDLVRAVTGMETKKSLSRKTTKKLLSWLSRTTSGGRIVDKLLKHIPLVFSEFAFIVEKTFSGTAKGEA